MQNFELSRVDTQLGLWSVHVVVGERVGEGGGGRGDERETEWDGEGGIGRLG